MGCVDGWFCWRPFWGGGDSIALDDRKIISQRHAILICSIRDRLAAKILQPMTGFEVYLTFILRIVGSRISKSYVLHYGHSVTQANNERRLTPIL